MDRKHRVYESFKREIDERERRHKAKDRKALTRCEIERLVHKYRELQLSMLDEYKLTKQEKTVVFYVLFGISYSNIAKLMVLEDSTISFHIRNIFQKCHVSCRQDLCLLILIKMYFTGFDQDDEQMSPASDPADQT